MTNKNEEEVTISKETLDHATTLMREAAELLDLRDKQLQELVRITGELKNLIDKKDALIAQLKTKIKGYTCQEEEVEES